MAVDALRFEYWDTPKLAEMVRLARQRAAEAQARFAASGAEDRRLGKSTTYQSEVAHGLLRRAEDSLDQMRTELKRRSMECFVERRSGPRRGPEHRRGWWWDRLPAPNDQPLEGAA